MRSAGCDSCVSWLLDVDVDARRPGGQGATSASLEADEPKQSSTTTTPPLVARQVGNTRNGRDWDRTATRDG
jgi:hypothetical protein